MKILLLKRLRKKTKHWPQLVTAIVAALAAFSTYTCMYAFRKAFAAGTYQDLTFLNIDYKVLLVIAQVLGYTLSKFYGIRFISEVKSKNRGRSIVFLIVFSWVSLLGFALVPSPYNIIFLFLNGFPLGMIWGLVFSYLEGRRTTEFMAAVMSVSMIFASGFVKTIGRTLVINYHVNEFWMPFVTGLIFIIPLLICVLVIEIIPPPNELDKASRVERVAMNATHRRKFLINFFPGILLTIVIYTLLTIMRDVRDNFEVEIWAGLGINNSSIYTRIDSLISIVVLIFMGLLILIRNNLKAFTVIHILIIAGCVTIGISTFLYQHQYISPTLWMTFAGLGLYMGYLPYNAIFFERMIAAFEYKSNVGFVMYLADAMGYLGSISVLLFKQFGDNTRSWATFFEQGIYLVAFIGGISAIFSLIYFLKKAYKQKTHSEPELKMLYV
jgi:MFS family permease